MPGPQQIWHVTDPRTGQPTPWVGDHEPSDQELDQFFAQKAGGVPHEPQLFQGTQNRWGIGPEPTTMQKIRQNLPLIGGMGMGLGASLASGGILTPVAAATVGAFTGSGLKDVWRSTDSNLPMPPTSTNYTEDVGRQMLHQGGDAVEYGTVPELAGHLAGLPIGWTGDVLSRIGTEGPAGTGMFGRFTGRNARAFEEAANPKGLNVSRTGGEVGQQLQGALRINKENAEAPLSQKYDQLMQGKFGQQREIYRDPATGRMAKGDSIAEMHEDRKALLSKGITARESTSAMAPRTKQASVTAANEVLDRIKKTAAQHNMSADEYVDLSNKWRDVQDTFGNPMQRTMQNGPAGGSVIDALTLPNKWPSYTPKGGAAKLDQAQLADRFLSTINPTMRDKVKAAVTKRIMNVQGTTDGAVVPSKLLSALDRMDKYGVTDKLVNNADTLRKYAQVLQKYGDTPKVPGMMWKASFINKMLDRGLGDPDVARMAKRMAGSKGFGQWFTELGTKGAVGAAEYDDGKSDSIPQPPER